MRDKKGGGDIKEIRERRKRRKEGNGGEFVISLLVNKINTAWGIFFFLLLFLKD